MDDNTEDLLAQRAETLVRIKGLLGRIGAAARLLLVLTENPKQENNSAQLLCGCCDDGKADQPLVD